MKSRFSAQHGIADRDDEEAAGAPTLWSLAWSEDEDSIAHTDLYGGGDVPPHASPRRLRLPALLFGIAATAAAVAIGGLVITLTGAEAQPTTVITGAANRAVSAPSPRPNTDGLNRGDLPPSPQPVPARPASTAAEVIPGVANVPQRVVNSPAPAVATNSLSMPEATTPQNTASPASPAESAPAASAPAEDTAPEAAPNPAPPVIDPPLVSVAVVPPEQVLHPVGPPVLTVPGAAAAPHPVLVVPPRIPMPAAPAVPNPIIALPVGTTLHPFAPRIP